MGLLREVWSISTSFRIFRIRILGIEGPFEAADKLSAVCQELKVEAGQGGAGRTPQPEAPALRVQTQPQLPMGNVPRP